MTWLEWTKGQLSGDAHTAIPHKMEDVRALGTSVLLGNINILSLKRNAKAPVHSMRLSDSLGKQKFVLPVRTRGAVANNAHAVSLLNPTWGTRETLGPTYSLSLVRDHHGLCCLGIRAV